MKIRITGQLGEPVQRGATIVTSMRCPTKATSPKIPEGLLGLPDMTVVYTVLIAPRHWKTVTDLQAKYMLEGICIYDTDLKGIVVMTTSLKSLQHSPKGKS